MQKWTDKTIMPIGKHKGVALANIPASWFIWMHDVYGCDKTSPLGVYIEENIDVLREQNKRQNKYNSK